MKKMITVFGIVLMSSTVFAVESGVDLSSLESENIVGLKMYSVSDDSTLEFEKTGFSERSKTEDGAQNTCSGKYSIVKKLLGTSARRGKVFLLITERKCSVSDSVHVVSYYVELPHEFKLGVEIPVISGGLAQESQGQIEKRPSLVGTGDHDGVTFSK